MPTLLVVGGGLFGSLAAAYARSKGIEVVVFDAVLSGAASHAAAGLFKEAWAGKKLAEHFRSALPLLDRLYGIQNVPLLHADGSTETFLCVPPRLILEYAPVRDRVDAVGDGWLEAGGRRYEGWVYIAAGIWCDQFLPGLELHGRAGAAFAFTGERLGRICSLAYSRQAIAFTRDPGRTYFSDGTAAREYSDAHEQQTLAHAAALGLEEMPVDRYWGWRPYTPKGPVFLRVSARTWLATGGRKMGTILGASFARQLVEVQLR